jgi:arabinofuranosyltransferase
LYLQTSNTAGFRRLVIAGGAAAFLLLLLRTAWLDDDAYITFRTVDNFLNGLGLRWNVVNRVQAFTHPLWMLAVAAAAAIGGEVYFSSLALSIVVSLAAVTLAASRIASTPPMAVLVFMSLALSKAFVDYSTSGLENPLTHLLLVGFFLGLVSDLPRPRRLLVLSLATALLIVNRFDTGLLVLPALAVEVWRSGWRAAVVPVAVGMLPLAAWEIFSVVYYGFPFPNTAYSKLKTGVPAPEIHYQGFLYLLDSIANDPLTLLVIATAIFGPIVFGGGWSVPVGIFVYLVYVVRVGGDFMSGRFLTAPFLLSVLWLSRARMSEFAGAWVFAAAVVAVVGLSAPRPTILSNASYGSDIEPARVIAPTGITDERRYYYPQSGLLTAQRGVPMPNHRWTHMGHDLTNRGETFFSTDAAGFIGYAAGPSVTFLDRYGLGDPLLARLPAEAPWRIGHFVREVPEGYPETLQAGRDHIRDSGVAVYYDKLQIITEGPLFTAERWHTILRMNLGRYERYIADYGLLRVRWEDVAGIKPDRTDWNLPENVRLSLRGVEVSLPQDSRGRIELSVSRNDTYTVVFLNNGRAVGERRLRQRMQADSSLQTHTVELPPDVVFDAVRVQPSAGDARYALGHLRVVP